MKTTLLFLGLFWLACGQPAWAGQANQPTLMIGWAQGDITPTRTVAIGGMTSLRQSTGVADPLTVTALALEAPYQSTNPSPVILVGCDLRSISQTMLDAIRSELRKSHPEIDPQRLIISGTHTHNAPPLWSFGGPPGFDEAVMFEDEYIAFAAPRIAAVIHEAWQRRRPGGISYGLSHAVVGHNRIMAYESGESRMGGDTRRADFSHVEGYEDAALNLLYTWDSRGALTGVLVNAAVTAQTRQSESVISADFWHETRSELRRRLGENLFVLPQCSAAGDQMSRPFVHARAEARMEKLSGRNRREQIATRLADGVMAIYPVMRQAIEWAPVLAHQVEEVGLTRRILSAQDVETAAAEGKTLLGEREQILGELAADRNLARDREWITRFTRNQRNLRRTEVVRERFELQQREPRFPVELHVVRLGDMALASNPFELYLDFGVQIKTRSPAVQTFLVELANGSYGYVPTARSVGGGAYGAVPASTNVGPEGGKELVTWTVEAIEALWQK